MSGTSLNLFDRPTPVPSTTLRYGDHPDQLIDVFGPDNAGPWLILLHGGFWRTTYDRSHMSHLATALAGAGRRVASVEYRRIPGDPDSTTSDVLAALDSLGPSGATLIGFSAGGHLALWACSSGHDVARVVAIAPVADLGECEARNLGSGAVLAFLGQPAAQRPDLDPILLTPNCQVVIVGGDSDDRVPIELSRRYAVAKDARMIELPNVGHFDLVDPTLPTFNAVLSALE